MKDTEFEALRQAHCNGARQFRKKPVVITAIQITDENLLDLLHMTTDGDPAFKVLCQANGTTVLNRVHSVEIHTLEGVMLGMPGDWIITGINGERYPCKPDIFEKSYEAV